MTSVGVILVTYVPHVLLLLVQTNLDVPIMLLPHLLHADTSSKFSIETQLLHPILEPTATAEGAMVAPKARAPRSGKTML